MSLTEALVITGEELDSMTILEKTKERRKIATELRKISPGMADDILKLNTTECEGPPPVSPLVDCACEVMQD